MEIDTLAEDVLLKVKRLSKLYHTAVDKLERIEDIFDDTAIEDKLNAIKEVLHDNKI